MATMLNIPFHLGYLQKVKASHEIGMIETQ